MDYKITIGTSTRTVEIGATESANSNEYLVLIKEEDRSKVSVKILERVGNRIIFSIGKKVYSVLLEEKNQSSLSFVVNGKRVHAKMSDLTKYNNTSSLLATANELVTSNFPAKVVKLVAKKDDALKEGDLLIVLEAMKMEAQIKAPRECVVVETFVKEGEMVERGKPMIRLRFR